MKMVDGWALKSALGAMSFMFCGLTQAQSNVTLYGVVDGGLLYTSKMLNTVTGQNGGKTFAMNDSGLTSSLFGLKGTEDLGGGLKVNFDLESGFERKFIRSASLGCARWKFWDVHGRFAVLTVLYCIN
jgi:predicted porin